MRNIQKMSIGVNYKIKNNVYLIDFEEKQEDKKYKMIVSKDFISDITEYHVTQNAYGITKNKLIDLLHKHAVDKPQSLSLDPESKQFIVSYMYERLPECFYFMDELLEIVNNYHENGDKIWDNMTEKFKNYTHMVYYKVYGGYPDNDNFNIKYKNRLQRFHKNSTHDTISTNTELMILIDTIHKLINNETESTINCICCYVNKYK